jgi:hypothetical protein
VRSNAYFRDLFDQLGNKLGAAQSWQIIPKAVERMEHDFGKECERLPR